jgi:mannobiose 2-epimerase
MPEPIDRFSLRSRMETELREDILPFWIQYSVDPVHGGFVGALTNQRAVHNEVPRTGILCARILWTYSAAYNRLQQPELLSMALKAFTYLTGPFWDENYGGIYWSIDAAGQPVMDRKHTYTQAFAIYGLSEYYRASQDPEALRLAQELFGLVEGHAHEPVHGGYIEGSRRDWSELDDMRLSDREINCRKSMNTLLHVMEAYTSLLQTWDNTTLRQRLTALVRIFLNRVIDPQTHHFRLFFDDAWNSLGAHDSYGHDIEGSWLLVEAAETLGDGVLLAEARTAALSMAAAVLAEGISERGFVIYEGYPDGSKMTEQHWWAQAEGVVGFYHAYQLSGKPVYAQTAQRIWEYIETHFFDREYGEWFKVLDAQAKPVQSQWKVGPWECPYHTARACLEMMKRLD